ncbi:Glycine-zipper containing OmpA-like membrane domain-containing protein [Cetobacterium ceti]|uniref:Glycine-zipper containing OmpA-like membrane domain-containing protein n=2 Tax=Cetobacterium ceti TaxID=180163 RepID=A0A1T4MVH5_9FUSO|nr:Glycine-zipper containing OmpA-like membrane domain-containing protein [Cetobacterium ceti]
MKLKYFLCGCIFISLLSGCSNVGSNTIGSTGVGAGTGALLGQAIGGNSEATLIGAGAGAAVGAIVGAIQDQTSTIKQENKPVYYNQAPLQYNPNYKYQYQSIPNQQY